VASLGLVSPVAETDGVTLFFLEKTDDLSHRPLECDDLFLAVVSSSPLPSSRVVYPVFFSNSATEINFIRVSPPGWCHSRRSASPLSDATAPNFYKRVKKCEIWPGFDDSRI